MNFKKQIIIWYFHQFSITCPLELLVLHMWHIKFFKNYSNTLVTWILSDRSSWSHDQISKKKKLIKYMYIWCFTTSHLFLSLFFFIFLFSILFLQYSRFEFGHLGWVWISISRGVGCWTQILLLSIEAWISFL